MVKSALPNYIIVICSDRFSDMDIVVANTRRGGGGGATPPYYFVACDEKKYAVVIEQLPVSKGFEYGDVGAYDLFEDGAVAYDAVASPDHTMVLCSDKLRHWARPTRSSWAACTTSTATAGTRPWPAARSTACLRRAAPRPSSTCRPTRCA